MKPDDGEFSLLWPGGVLRVGLPSLGPDVILTLRATEGPAGRLDVQGEFTVAGRWLGKIGKVVGTGERTQPHPDLQEGR